MVAFKSAEAWVLPDEILRVQAVTPTDAAPLRRRGLAPAAATGTNPGRRIGADYTKDPPDGPRRDPGPDLAMQWLPLQAAPTQLPSPS
jgi:hypothetical protein